MRHPRLAGPLAGRVQVRRSPSAYGRATLLLLLFSEVCLAAPAPTPATAPTQDLRARKQARLFDFLMQEYGALLDKSKDRVSRGLIAVCIARIPRDDATDRLLDLAQSEKDPLVRVIAWQAVLARAPLLSAAQHQKWLAMTLPMAKADLFRGELRLPVARLLATAVPDRAAKDAWNALLLKAAASPREAATVDALCETLAQWQSPDLMDALVRKLATVPDRARADELLRLAGSQAAGPADHAKWWAKAKPTWKDRAAAPDNAWRSLTPQFVPAPPDLASVDPDDESWRKDLELRAPNLRAFDVAFCVDATGSMGSVLEWLKRDVAKLMQGFNAVALEPRIGLTFYRDKGDEFLAVTKPLTNRVGDLREILANMKAAGGGDLPEAVLDGLVDCYKNNRWNTSKEGKKVVVLIGDAPPHPETQKECEAVVTAAAGKGFRLYAVKCAKELPSFDDLADKGNGKALEVDMAELTNGRRAATPAPRAGGAPMRRPTPAAATDPDSATPATAPAGRRLLGLVLVDVINPQFKDRVEPLVSVLWEMLDEGAPAAR